MKRILLASLFMFSFSVSVFAIGSTLDVKAGVQYPTDIEKVGFDSAAKVSFGIDKYFAVGLESGFGWLNWEDKDSPVAAGNLNLTKVEKTNLYYVPLLAVATVRLSDLLESDGFMPYLSGGAGYSWAWYRHPEIKERFDGFTWQIVGGVAFKLGSDSNLTLLLEGGYRGAGIQNEDDFELDMSGPIGRVGVSFPLETTDY